jgi:ABC-type Fe3+/spermidine/putrescine transport system ATPase subunit
MTHARLELNSLSYRYNNKASWALADLSLSVESGEMVALLGPSGSGKTTALRLICGLLHPCAGQVLVDGRPMNGLPPERRDTAMVFQNGLLFEHMSVAANVAFGLRMRRLPKPEIARRVAAALDQVYMRGFGGRRPRELSGGEQQRVALARALVIRPRVLLLDEPLSSLDASLRGELRELLIELQREGDHTTVFVTHDQQEAVRVAGRIGLLFDGRLQMYDRPRAFYERPVNRAVAEFFGARNFVAGYAEHAVLQTAFGALKLNGQARRGVVTATIRPEAIRLGDGENAMRANVESVDYLGTRIQYGLRLGKQRLDASFPPHVKLALGAAITVRLPAEALWLLASPESNVHKE